MEHDGMNHNHGLVVDCNGEAVSRAPGGSWQGHVLPGLVFIIWGSYWFVSVIMQMHASRVVGQPYRAQPWHPFRNRWLRYAEPMLKILLPCVAISIELYFDHIKDGGFQRLFCKAGTKRAGEFDLTNLNNWSHASSYPAFIFSGIVDLVGSFGRSIVPLPDGTEHGVLTVAFGAMAFLMGVHEKHEPQDKAVHWLLFVCMTCCFIVLALEVRFSRLPLVSIAKGLATVFTGAWLIQIAKIEFEDHPQWDVARIPPGVMHHPGAMMAPVYFVAIGVSVMGGGLVSYSMLTWLLNTKLIPMDCSETISLLPYSPLHCNDDGMPFHGERHGIKKKKSDGLYSAVPQFDGDVTVTSARKRELV